MKLVPCNLNLYILLLYYNVYVMCVGISGLCLPIICRFDLCVSVLESLYTYTNDSRTTRKNKHINLVIMYIQNK